MRRSKLEMYVDTLKVLARHGPLKLTHIMYKANVNCSVLKQYLDFLTQQNLVEEQTLHKKRNKNKNCLRHHGKRYNRTQILQGTK
jgi:predicted transcriptional regulator